MATSYSSLPNIPEVPYMGGLFDAYFRETRGWRAKHGAPRNWQEQFLCVLSDQFFSLIGVNLLYALFWVPGIVWSVSCVFQILDSFEANLVNEAVAYMNTWLLGLIPCSAIIGPAHAGMSLLLRNWAAEDYTPITATFFKGFRENWKKSLLTSAFTGMIPVACWYSFSTALLNNAWDTVSVFVWLVAIFYLFWILMQQLVYPLMVTYDLPLLAILRNSLILTIIKVVPVFLVKLANLFIIGLYLGFSYLYPEMRYVLLLVPVLYYFFLGFAISELSHGVLFNRLRKEHLADRENPTPVGEHPDALEEASGDEDDYEEYEESPKDEQDEAAIGEE